MKIFLLASLLLLSGCMAESETIIICDSMDAKPDVSVGGSVYVDDIIR